MYDQHKKRYIVEKWAKLSVFCGIMSGLSIQHENVNNQVYVKQV